MTSQNPVALNTSRPEDDLDLDLASVVRTLQRRRRLFFLCFAAVLVLAALYLLFAKRTYRADAEMQLVTENVSAGVSTLAGGDTDASALQLSTTLQTYVGVLTSDTLALEVIWELGLEQTPEFRTAVRKGEEGLPLEQSRFRREAVLRRFRRNLSVTAGSGSKLLMVSYKSVDPATAKRVLDRLLDDFIHYNLNLRMSASERSQSWLREQLVDLRAQVQRSEQAAAEAQRNTGIYGTDGSRNLVLSRLEGLQTELISAEQNRIVKGAILHRVEAGDPEAVSNLSGAAGQSSSPGAVNALALVQSLRQQEAVFSSQYAQLSANFGPGYPRVAEVEKQLADVRAAIRRETDRLNERAVNDFKAAAEQESLLAREVDEQKALANKSNDASIRYLVASREAASTRDLYEHLLEKAKELGAVAGLGASDIEVIDPAHVGTARTPGILTTMAGAAGAGLVLALCVVLLRDGLDPTLYKPELLASLTGIRLLGAVPALRPRELGRAGEHALQAASRAPGSRFTESLRMIRTALFSPPYVQTAHLLLVASPARGDGKAVFAANFAAVLAQGGRTVLLVDADLRRGLLSRGLGAAAAPGLGSLLAGTADVSSESEAFPPLLQRIGAVDFLPSGPAQPLPAELLSGPRMDALLALWRSRYDFVVLTSSPVNAVTDTVSLAPKMDGVLLLGRAGVTTKAAFVHAAELLRAVGAPLLGAIYNAVDTHSPEYRSYAGNANDEEAA